MTIQRPSSVQTLQLIVDMLRFDETNQEGLKEQLKSSNFDWDNIVMVASEHLVLPAVYCRLQQKSLLEFLPNDLVLYLEELTELNRNRNRTLLEESRFISQLFVKHQIEHVFIKGIAFLLGNYYIDNGERMVGDIDILVKSQDLNQAFNLLVAEGYSQFVTFNYEVKNFRHKPRQISENHIGAIELHDELLKDGSNHLIDKQLMLTTKELKNDCAIPNSEFLIRNTILADQINNHQSYFRTLNLKGIYDILVTKLDKKPDLIHKLSNENHSLRFLSLASLFVTPIAPVQKNVDIKIYREFYLFTLKFPKVGRMIYKSKLLYISVKERLELFLFNRSYRKHVLKNKL